MGGRTDGRRDGCYDNYMKLYGMEWVHNREPEQSRVIS